DRKISSILTEDCSVKLVIENGGHSGEVLISSPVQGFKSRPRDKNFNNVVYEVTYDKLWQLIIKTTDLGGVISRVDLVDGLLIFEGTTTSRKYHRAVLKNYGSNYSKELVLEYTEDNNFTISEKIDFML